MLKVTPLPHNSLDNCREGKYWTVNIMKGKNVIIQIQSNGFEFWNGIFSDSPAKTVI